MLALDVGNTYLTSRLTSVSMYAVAVTLVGVEDFTFGI